MYVRQSLAKGGLDAGIALHAAFLARIPATRSAQFGVAPETSAAKWRGPEDQHTGRSRWSSCEGALLPYARGIEVARPAQRHRLIGSLLPSGLAHLPGSS